VLVFLSICQKIIIIFIAQSRVWPTSPIAKNVIEGNIAETVAFLDDLAYSSNITPGVLVMREKYQATLARSWAGGCERPANWRESFEEENVQPSESKDRPSAMNHHTRPQNDT
jgi:hypothetical protein